MKHSILVVFAILIASISYAQKKSSGSQKARITNCLCSYTFSHYIAKYKFYKNGKYEYQQSNPYPLYKTGTWSYLSGNKVKINKPWIGKSETVTVDENCDINWGY